MPYRDLREWLDALERAGELQKVEREVDWNLEAGAITRRVYDLKAPAPLFQKIKGYPKGYRILGGPIGLSARNKYARLASALDMPVDSTIRDLTEEYIKRKKNPIPPVEVKRGPCQEIIITGEDIDLFKFPAPMVHDGDGGRYLCSWHTVISKHPENDWVNFGMYRQMVHDRNHLSIPAVPMEHIGQHYQRYGAKGKRMEFATAIGTEPVTALISATALPAGVNEADIIGALRGEPLELVRCRTVDLLVPATSEIVIEGYIEPEERREEGPFGEYTGYSAGGKQLWPVCTVTAITHRNDPIVPMSVMGVPVDDAAVVMNFTMGAEVLEELRDKRQFPVDFVYYPPEGVAHICLVSTKGVPKAFTAYPRSLAMSVWSTKSGHDYSNLVMLVNDDVDITDPGQIMWALATRVHPDRDIWKLPGTFSVVLLPWLTPEEKEKMIGARLLIDATWPADWPKEWIPTVSSFENIWPKSVQEMVLKNWKEYGFKE
jgi:4-hydroxy-3-polyprenylbenzoate decarboxylase